MLHFWIFKKSKCNVWGVFWRLLDECRIIFHTSPSTSQNKTVWFCFLTSPAACMVLCMSQGILYQSKNHCLHLYQFQNFQILSKMEAIHKNVINQGKGFFKKYYYKAYLVKLMTKWSVKNLEKLMMSLMNGP